MRSLLWLFALLALARGVQIYLAHRRARRFMRAVSELQAQGRTAIGVSDTGTTELAAHTEGPPIARAAAMAAAEAPAEGPRQPPAQALMGMLERLGPSGRQGGRDHLPGGRDSIDTTVRKHPALHGVRATTRTGPLAMHIKEDNFVSGVRPDDVKET